MPGVCLCGNLAAVISKFQHIRINRVESVRTCARVLLLYLVLGLIQSLKLNLSFSVGDFRPDVDTLLAMRVVLLLIGSMLGFFNASVFIKALISESESAQECKNVPNLLICHFNSAL